MKQIEKILFPESIKEVNKLILSNEGSKILAGGTDLVPGINSGKTDPKILICLNRIFPLKEIYLQKNGDLFIGAMATLTEIEENPLTANCRALILSIAEIGSRQIRNKATLTGNLCNASPAADSLSALVVLDSRIIISTGLSEYELPVCDFITGPGKTILKPGELVTGIRIPKIERKFSSEFLRLGRRKSVDLASVSASCLLTDNGEIRLAAGAVSPRPKRLHKLEAALLELDNISLIDKVINNIELYNIDPISDIRAGKDYRMAMTAVLVKRCIIKANNSLENIDDN